MELPADLVYGDCPDCGASYDVGYWCEQCRRSMCEECWDLSHANLLHDFELDFGLCGACREKLDGERG